MSLLDIDFDIKDVISAKCIAYLKKRIFSRDDYQYEFLWEKVGDDIGNILEYPSMYCIVSLSNAKDGKRRIWLVNIQKPMRDIGLKLSTLTLNKILIWDC
jgi:hypothetical protein